MAKRNCWGKKKRFFNRFYCTSVVFVLFAMALFFIIEVQIKPIVEAVAAQRAHMAVIRLINESVYDQLGQGISYQQLISVHKDESGRVVLMQPDTIKISRLATSIAQELEEKVGNLGSEGIKIPAGLLTGYTVLADKGPDIKLGIRPMGEVSVNVRDEFVEAGINQTKHRVVLDVSVSLGIMIPFNPTMTEVKNSLPIVESIIVGPIPDTYLNMEGGLGGLLTGGQTQK